MITDQYPKDPITISSKAEMDCEMRRIHTLFKNKETEESWEQLNSALMNVTRWVEEDKVHEYDGFVKHIKQLHDGINRTLLSQRTRLAGMATQLLETLATNMGRAYEPLHDLFHATLVSMFARTKKVTVKQAVTCMMTIIEAAKMPRYIPRFADIITNRDIRRNPSTLASAAACIEKAVEVNAIEAIEPYLGAVEASIRVGITKPAAEVRASLRSCFQTYQRKMPEKAARFHDRLPELTRKYLNPPQVKSERARARARIVCSSSSGSGSKVYSSNDTKKPSTGISTNIRTNNETSINTNINVSDDTSNNTSSKPATGLSSRISSGRGSLPHRRPPPIRPVITRRSAPHSHLDLPARSAPQRCNIRSRLQTKASATQTKPALNTATTTVARVTKRRTPYLYLQQ
ncbi:clasp N terminal-domain-containing protein [Dichotomocladium elegans]|nr:clasp N terminal-domain-containing protein [Dichotomocladium elegans]